MLDRKGPVAVALVATLIVAPAKSLADGLTITTGGASPARIHTGAPSSITTESAVEPSAQVILAAPGEVQLARWSDGTWVEICANPCNVRLSRLGHYRLQGMDRVPTKPFTLDSRWVEISAQLASRQDSELGFIFLALGVGLSALGTDALAVGVHADAQHGDLFSGNAFAGVILIGVGISAIVGGIVRLTQANTHYLTINGKSVASVQHARPWVAGRFEF